MILILSCFHFLAIIRDVVQKRFEVYHKLEEAARLAAEQEAAARAAEERKIAEEIAAKASKAAVEETKADEAGEQGDQEAGVEGDGRETADKPEEDSVAGEDAGSEQAPTADTPAGTSLPVP